MVLAPAQRVEGQSVDSSMGEKILNSLLEIKWSSLKGQEQLDYVRTIQIALIRFDSTSEATRKALIAKLDPTFPAETFELNWLLCETLSFLQAPNTAAKGMALIASAESQEPQMQYARSLRMLKTTNHLLINRLTCL